MARLTSQPALQPDMVTSVSSLDNKLQRGESRLSNPSIASMVYEPLANPRQPSWNNDIPQQAKHDFSKIPLRVDPVTVGSRYTQSPRSTPLVPRPSLHSHLTSAPLHLQPKLTVNEPGDKYEQEADRIAEQVMRMPEPSIQRQCACEVSGGECPDCKKKQLSGLSPSAASVQRSAVTPVPQDAPPSVHAVLNTPGQPLDSATRSFFEPRFGRSLADVRIHDNPRAAESAASVRARAYTVGSQIVLGTGSRGDRDLLAHEITHVVQQTSNQPRDLGVQRQENAVGVHEGIGLPAHEGIPSEKWSEQAESAYRQSGNVVAANAVRNCRLTGDCSKLLTTNEAWNAYRSGRKEAKLGEPPETQARSNVAIARVAAVPGVSGAARSGATTALERAAIRWGSAEVIEGGAGTAAASGTAGAATVAVPIAMGVVLVVSVIDLMGYATFESALRNAGYLVLPDPLGVCVGLCHQAPATKPQTNWKQFGDPSPLDQRAITDWIRGQPDPKASAPPLPSASPAPQSQSRPTNNCFEKNPSFTICEDGHPTVEEAAVDALVDSNYSFDALGECRGFKSFDSGTIKACDGAPGETFHCKVKGTSDEISVFGCMCCDEEGNAGMTYRSPHWSVFMGKKK